MIWTNRSTPPLELGWYADDRICLIPFMCVNCLNNSDVNCELLSLTSCNGTPNFENHFFNVEIFELHLCFNFLPRSILRLSTKSN